MEMMMFKIFLFMCFFALFKQIEEGIKEFIKLILLGGAYLLLGISRLYKYIKSLFI